MRIICTKKEKTCRHEVEGACTIPEDALWREGGCNYRKREQDRTVFSTGAFRNKKDLSQGRYDLLPWEAIHELAIHCAEGAEVHGERNCEKGIPIHSLIDSAIRHLSCYMRGMDDEPHLRAAMWNIAFAIWTEKNRPEMQDIPVRKLQHVDE